MTALQVMEAMARAFEAARIPYMVVGSLSVSAYGVPRSTKDADFVVELDQSSLAVLVGQLGTAFALDSQMSFETITCTSRYRLNHVSSGFLIEMFLLSQDPHDRERFVRRRKLDIGGTAVYVAAPEDVVITKLRWSRQGNRAKDIDDVRNVIAVRGEVLDWNYIQRWCDVHGTAELLDRVRAAAQQP